MTKNNKVECWEPKNCGKSSKCGECITLKLKLLANPKFPTFFFSNLAPIDSQESSNKIIFLFLIISLIFLMSAGNPRICATNIAFVFFVILFSSC